MDDGKRERAERLAKAMDGRSIAWLHAAVGVALSTAHSYVKKGAVPPADIAFRIADALNIDVRWYITGEGTPPETSRSGGAVDVPLVNHNFDTVGSLQCSASLIEALGAKPEDVRCLLPEGAAMRPSVPEGAETLFVPMPPLGPIDGRVYVLSVRGRAVVRRVASGMSGEWFAVMDNPAFRMEPKERIPDDAFVGEVIWVSHRP